jgi:glutaredoxin 3
MKPEIELYTMGHCPFCRAAKNLLRSKGITDWSEIDLEIEQSYRSEMVARSGGRKTVPQIFINGQHIGGSDDLHTLDARGGLDPLLGPASNQLKQAL